MTAVPPKLNLGGLTGFDSGVLASVDFSAQTVSGRQTPQTIAFHADDQARSVKTSGAIGTIDVSVDMSSPAILGNASQRAAAMAPNPLRPGEKDGFSYEVSQETQVTGHDDTSAPTRQRQAEWTQTLSAIHAGVGLQSDPTRIDASANRA